ncbi:hypothetical protein ACEPAH_3747 [Sanghuangporus vaninii]
MFRRLCALLFCLLSSIIPSILAQLPDKIYGVNLGSWLLIEPWMLPKEWKAMGGEICDDCSDCIASEFAFAQAYPDSVDEIFDSHWSSWFTQSDVDNLASWGINTVRLPLGYWIVEPLVDRKTEFYPRGGIKQLKRGLRQLKAAGIKVILDHHALPGVSSPNQMFAGRCTSDVQFYTDYNYHRALVWTAVMTALSHLDSDFASVVGIEAVNEPIQDASQTPDYGDFQKNFVRVIRAVETLLGVVDLNSTAPSGLLEKLLPNTLNATKSILGGSVYGGSIGTVLLDAAPMIAEIAFKYGFDSILGGGCPNKTPLTSVFMDIGWQWNNPSNPADAAIGRQAYDNHLYYAYGGVANATEEAYLTSICNLDRVENDAALGNTPLFFGEWSLATQWTPTDEFLMKWADAQKRAYSEGAGWMFWSFKIEKSEEAGDYPRVWSYSEAIERGYMMKDPSKLNDEHVCDHYINSTSTSA